MNRFLMVFGLFSVGSQLSFAEVVYQQPPVWSGSGTVTGSAWTSQVDAGANGYRTFDSFSLGSTADIGQATWLGIYLDSATLSNAPPNTANWNIGFYADNSGSPGIALQSTSLTSGQVGTVLLGTGLFGANTVDIYQFTANLPAFNAVAGTTYWFSPLSQATSFDPLFSMIEGTGGDGFSFQMALAAGADAGDFVRDGDRAFSLSSTPEPSTGILLGLALAAGLLARRRFA